MFLHRGLNIAHATGPPDKADECNHYQKDGYNSGAQTLYIIQGVGQQSTQRCQDCKHYAPHEPGIGFVDNEGLNIPVVKALIIFNKNSGRDMQQMVPPRPQGISIKNVPTAAKSFVSVLKLQINLSSSSLVL